MREAGHNPGQKGNKAMAMTMTQLFANGYKTIAAADSLQTFNKRCRRFGDSMTSRQLLTNGVSQAEIKSELEQGFIKYEPAVQKRPDIGGYSLTEKGIKEVYNLMQKEG